MRRRLLRGGEVLGSAAGGGRAADVLIDAAGLIERVEPGLTPPDDAEVIDCAGQVILPGLFDMHVHLREPGREDEETIETGARAAVRGGVTGICAMPNTSPPIDSGGHVRFVQVLAREQARIPVWTAGCITRGRAGEALAEIADMHRQGVVMITDDGDPVEDAYLFRRALEYARHYDLLVACHCEVPSLSRGGAMNEGAMSYRLGVPGIPACSEEISIERDVRLAQYTGARIHIQHVTTARGMEIIRRFKEEGVRVTCEVTPHHLLFNETDIGDYDTALKMNPPLRLPEDQAALLEGLKQGWIDVLATDHAPHTEFEKNLDFAAAPFGITGLETALVSLYDRLIAPGALDWAVLIERFCDAPRRILGLEPVAVQAGMTANLVVFDPAGETRFDRGSMCSRSINTPWLDQTLRGRVAQVVLGSERLWGGPDDVG
jgi:dihydroorotase